MSLVTNSVKIWRRSESISKLIGIEGKIESFTIVRVAPDGFAHYAPFPVAIVKTANGKKIMGQITDYHEDDVRVGRKVIAVLRRLYTEDKKDVIPYVIKFKPL